MALAHSPRIITDGLVLCLDAGNTKSYPGSGTSWTDLSRNGNNATLVNTPTFSSANGGVLVFNGTTQYASCTIPALTYYSLSFWIYVISLPASGEEQIFGAPSDIASISLLFSGGAWKWNSWSGTQSRTGAAMSTGTWYNFVMTNFGATTKFYVNGSLSSTFGSGVTMNAGTGYFCDVTAGFGRNLNANVGNISFYNREFTAAEVKQNFNALRGRYGI